MGEQKVHKPSLEASKHSESDKPDFQEQEQISKYPAGLNFAGVPPNTPQRGSKNSKMQLILNLQRTIGNAAAKRVMNVSSGVNQSIQRDSITSQAPNQRQDEEQARLLEMLYTPVGENVQLLLEQARELYRIFNTSDNNSQSYQTALRLLRQSRSILERLAQSAPRGSDGTLMFRPIFTPDELQPWHPGATRIEDVQQFNQLTIPANPATGASGQSAANSSQTSASPTPASTSSVSSPSAAPTGSAASPTANSQSATPALDEAPTPSLTISTDTQEHPLSSDEQTPQTGDEVRRGLGILRGSTLTQAVAALNTGGVARVSSGSRGSMSLLNASQNIWFLSSRLYVLDRSGHIAPGDFMFSYSSAVLDPGGIYFLGRFRFQGEGLNEQGVRLLRLDGGVRLFGGDVSGVSDTVDTLPLLAMARSALGANHGIAVIVSESVPTTRQSHGFHPERLALALRLIPRYAPRALMTKLRRYVDNPTQLPLEVLRSMVMQRLSSIFSQFEVLSSEGEGLASRLGSIASVVSILSAAAEGIEWGSLVGIAAAGRSDDEAHISAQAIARKLVDVLFEQIINHMVGPRPEQGGNQDTPTPTPAGNPVSPRSGNTLPGIGGIGVSPRSGNTLPGIGGVGVPPRSGNTLPGTGPGRQPTPDELADTLPAINTNGVTSQSGQSSTSASSTSPTPGNVVPPRTNNTLIGVGNPQGGIRAFNDIPAMTALSRAEAEAIRGLWGQSNLPIHIPTDRSMYRHLWQQNGGTGEPPQNGFITRDRQYVTPEE